MLTPLQQESAPAHGKCSTRRAVRGSMLFVAAMATALGTAGFAAAAPAADAGSSQVAALTPPVAGQPDLGPNVKIFDPSMPIADIQATVDAVKNEQIDSEMGTGRYALLFKPGTYGTAEHPLIFQVGYYTEVAGLGQSPKDVVINGHIDVYNRCLETDANGNPSNCLALDNFWRSMSNLTINVQSAGLDGCRGTAEFWAVSQASPLRRVNVTGGNMTFMDYCTAGPQYASGGFIADSMTGFLINGSQQQFFLRNSTIGGWSNGVWNQVFAGVVGAPPQSFPADRYTTLATNPASREKPYLYIDAAGVWNVFVPDAASNSSGTTWANGQTPGHAVPLSDFLIAKPSDSDATINRALSNGKHLLFTPGVYDVDEGFQVRRANTIVLGLGIATLNAVNGSVPITVANVKGVDIAGIMLDAGVVNSPALMRIGTSKGGPSSASTPTALQDVFLRVGGHSAGKATVALEVNSSNVILDDVWSWRADHGAGVGWTSNTSDTGLIVNGDNVTATGLFVEHYQKYNVIWNGEKGKTIFFQNELPYDAPNQAAWQHDGVLGYAAYKVADNVKTHELWGGGSYIFTNVDPTIHATRGFEVPVTPGVKMHDLLTVELSAGTIDHVINNTGDPVTSAAIGVPSFVTEFPTP